MKVMLTENKLEKIMLRYIQDIMKVDLEPTVDGNNLYYRDKEKTTNINLLKRIHTVMNEMDLSVLTPLEFKKLGYGNKK